MKSGFAPEESAETKIQIRIVGDRRDVVPRTHTPNPVSALTKPRSS